MKTFKNNFYLLFFLIVGLPKIYFSDGFSRYCLVLGISLLTIFQQNEHC